MKNLYTTFLFIKVIAVSNYKLSTFFIIFLIKFAVKLTWQYKTEGSLSKIDQDSFIWPLRRLFKTFIFILWLWLNQKFVCPLFILSTKRTREMFVRAVFHALLMNCSTRWSEGCTYCLCWSEHTHQHQLLSLLPTEGVKKISFHIVEFSTKTISFTYYWRGDKTIVLHIGHRQTKVCRPMVNFKLVAF